MNFYKDCAGILAKLEEKKGSIKSLVGTLNDKDRKRGAALIIQTLKYQPVLLEVVKASGILQQEKKLLRDRHLVILLVHDLLFAKGIQAADGPIKQAVLRHKTRLNAELIKAQIKQGAVRKEELSVANDLTANMRRWVRINTLRASQEDVLATLQNEGYKTVEPNTQDGDKCSIWEDIHIPHLLSFDGSAQLQDSRLLEEGKIILQDKASCFPATVLRPPSNTKAHVIDATAAPGNKTSHLSALMRGRGRITAFERDRKRFQTLEFMLRRAGAKNVVAKNRDFTSVNPLDHEYANVTHILLDPSCSGSGIVNRLDYLLPQEVAEADSEESKERLEKLATFQLKMILHAMKFPNLQRLVYSTCSIHATENEQVVQRALASEEAVDKFQLANRADVIPSWDRRGVDVDLSKSSNSFIRCLPEDGTNGFFVACLVRQESNLDLKRKAEVMEEYDAGSKETGHAKEFDGEPKRKKKKRSKKQSKET